jgi:hypothetical protein
LASKHHSLNLSEVADLTELLLQFEEHNQLRITLTVETLMRKTGPTLAVGAIAYNRGEDGPEAKPLAYVSVICSAINLRHWNAALTHVLYVLDSQLARNEMEGVAKK